MVGAETLGTVWQNALVVHRVGIDRGRAGFLEEWMKNLSETAIHEFGPTNCHEKEPIGMAEIVIGGWTKQNALL